MNSMPVLPVVKEALQAPLKNRKAMIFSLLIILAWGAVVAVMAFFAVWVLQSGNKGIFGLGVLVFLVVSLMFLAYFFNFWVRIGAFGYENSSWPDGGGVKAALVNGIKMLLIALLIGVVAVILNIVLTVAGLVEQPSIDVGDGSLDPAILFETIRQETMKGVTAAMIIMSAVYCIIYSLFSANLTQTALGSDREGFEHHYVKDFAIVLMVIYAVYLLAVFVGSLTGSIFIAMMLNVIVSFYISMAIPFAHGIRYRFCIAQMTDDQSG